VLDEPSSNLDSDGDASLLGCISDLKTRGVTVVIISHRPNTLGVVDKLLVKKEGIAELFGPRNEVIGHLASVKPTYPRPTPGNPGIRQSVPSRAFWSSPGDFLRGPVNSAQS
jgi:ABC-type protease/lipase transport system fused ATPase/permease subunit